MAENKLKLTFSEIGALWTFIIVCIPGVMNGGIIRKVLNHMS